ncbi:hypothetical protein SAMN05192555_108203 [Franzmannia pantelleriensis]|uniref:Uncharacterized protein n=1 Tax=Franzmannia pantelleriensis TaxID=48727 RepID=A0A1G9PSG0_9GAMM|nr:hypothetical protein SAMN05192555_108203 [Halomonas pantelleriensis]
MAADRRPGFLAYCRPEIFPILRINLSSKVSR